MPEPKTLVLCFSGSVVISEEELWPYGEDDNRPEHLDAKTAVLCLVEMTKGRKAALFEEDAKWQFGDELQVAVMDESLRSEKWE